jgi:hypothetical protein
MTELSDKAKVTWLTTIGLALLSARFFEILGALGMLTSKYFLAINSEWGWYLAIAGYMFTAIFMYKVNLKITVVVLIELGLLSLYGLYKWTTHTVGLQPIDFTVIALCSVFSLWLIVTEAKEKKQFWVLQTILTIAFSFATIFIGMKMDLGWYLLLVGHSANLFIHFQKRSYAFITIQAISIVIVLAKLFAG